MNNFGFNGVSSETTLAQLLKPYLAPQSENIQAATETQRMSSAGISVFEINSKSDIEYIEQDKSGRMQVYVCPNEKRVYTSRYNHVKKEPDYKAYIEEEEVKLFQKPDTSAEMSQITEVLLAVANKLDAMDGKIEGLKSAEPKKEESTRRANGQFKKKGES